MSRPPVPRPRSRDGRHVEYKESLIWNSRAANDVLHERRRQVEVEGWSSEHDDKHHNGEIARAAACYAMQSSTGLFGNIVHFVWPWGRAAWKPSEGRNSLVKAGALILAEIERLDRMAREPA